jgi:hypothetical protein
MARLLMTLSLVAAAIALCASPALARKRDHDRLPDRWERKFHLNLKKNDAKRDRDRDGLSNVREYRAHTNPRKKDTDHDGLKDGAERRFGFKPRDRDSDDDGIKDGKENAGKITALSGSSITIRLAAGGKLKAGLAIDCTPTGSDDSSGGADTGDDPEDNPADDPESDDSADDASADDPAETDGEDGDDLSASAAQDDDPSEAEDDTSDADFDKQFDAEFAGGETCDASSLKRGGRIHEATVDRSGPSPVVTAVTLVRR